MSLISISNSFSVKNNEKFKDFDGTECSVTQFATDKEKCLVKKNGEEFWLLNKSVVDKVLIMLDEKEPPNTIFHFLMKNTSGFVSVDTWGFYIKTPNMKTPIEVPNLHDGSDKDVSEEQLNEINVYFEKVKEWLQPDL